MSRFNDNKTPLIFDIEIWRVNQVAFYLGCSVKHVYNLHSQGRIPAVKKGKFLYFDPNEIREWILLGDIDV